MAGDPLTELRDVDEDFGDPHTVGPSGPTESTLCGRAPAPAWSFSSDSPDGERTGDFR